MTLDPLASSNKRPGADTSVLRDTIPSPAQAVLVSLRTRSKQPQRHRVVYQAHENLSGLALLKRMCITATMVLAVNGCATGKKGTVTVVKYPAFHAPGLKRVAVIPFENLTGVPGVAERFSNRLEGALINNRTYEVYTRQQLTMQRILEEADMAAAGIVQQDVAQRIGNLAAVQALVCGVYNQRGTNTQQETRVQQVARWGTNAKGKPVIVGWDQQPYVWIRHSAVVECNVVVIDTGTGRQWVAFNQPVARYSEGSPPRLSPAQVLQVTEDAAVQAILETIAMTRKQVRLRGSPLRLATDFYDQKWTWATKVTPADEKFFAVVSLPPEAARNTFKITIVPKEGREILAEQDFEWPAGVAQKGFEFSVGHIVEKGGFGKFKAKLYSGPEPIAWVDFTIAEVKIARTADAHRAKVVAPPTSNNAFSARNVMGAVLEGRIERR